jgi:hypothetical protein
MVNKQGILAFSPDTENAFQRMQVADLAMSADIFPEIPAKMFLF